MRSNKRRGLATSNETSKDKNLRTEAVDEQATADVSDAPRACVSCGHAFEPYEMRFRFGPRPGKKYATDRYPYADTCDRDACKESYLRAAWEEKQAQPARSRATTKSRSRRASNRASGAKAAKRPRKTVAARRG